MKFILLAAMAFSFLVSCASDRRFASATSSPPVVYGITFAVDPGKTYLPLREVEEFLARKTLSEEKRKTLRILTDGTPLVSLAELENAGVTVLRDPSGKAAVVRRGRLHLSVVVGSKRAVVDLSEQRLRAWQGERLVLKGRVSSGKNGRTPTGRFRAGPYKARRHYSSLYDNAPMPWSVQVSGNVFIHGFTSVPKYPASHGCIRVPLNEGNPAKFFYEWVSVGTPIQVQQ